MRRSDWDGTNQIRLLICRMPNPIHLGSSLRIARDRAVSSRAQETALPHSPVLVGPFRWRAFQGMATVFCHESADGIPWRTHEQRTGKLAGKIFTVISRLEPWNSMAPIQR